MLTSNIVRRVYLPHEQGEWFDFRVLSWYQLGECRQRVRDALLADAQTLGELAFKLPQGLNDVSRYDKGLLLRYGIAAWSYKEEIVSINSLEHLDARTADWAAEQVVSLAISQ